MAAAMVFLLIGVGRAAAHANLERAEPAPNSRLATAPEAIHLWFSEPVEPSFSKIELRDGSGAVAPTNPTEFAESNHQMALRPGDLPDGVYTVSWRVVSATDGHPTTGSYPITIGAGVSGAGGVVTSINTPVPAESAVVRWLNLLSMAAITGLPAFAVLIAAPSEQKPRHARRLWTATWIGWLAVGITSILTLLLQASILSGMGITPDALAQTAFETRFGSLWVARVVLWISYGLFLMFLTRPYVPLMVVAGLILVSQSLFSHASGVANAAPFIAADWLHLASMGTWIGGLIGLVVSIPYLREQPKLLGAWVARFSNMARVAVGLLVVTGVIAGIEHVGTLDALSTTPYGIALLVKLLLFLPLMFVAAVNLILTSYKLRMGEAVWSGRLRALVGIELTLAVAIIGAVGVMTAIPPAKIAFAERQAAAIPPPPDSTFFEMQIKEGVMVHLTITPGMVGENTFIVDLLDEETGVPIDDASLIRMRLTHQTENLGESELRPVLTSDGQYEAVGSNLSLPGEWRVRVNIQRPGHFDTLVDFEPRLPSADDLATRAAVMALQETGQALPMPPSTPTPSPFTDDIPVRMVTARNGNPPLLLTQGGTLLRPSESGYQPLTFDAPIRDAYMGLGDILWAATDAGLYRFKDEQWEQIGDFPADHVLSTHGYVFALGDGGILRAGEGGIELDVRRIDVPLMNQKADELVMLSNHTHVLLNGSDVYQTTSLGLGWKPLDAPENVIRIAPDADGNLLAVTDDALLEWDWTTSAWTTRAQLSGGADVSDVAIFNNMVYALMDGGLVRLTRLGWEQVVVSNAPESVLTDIAFQFPDTLWALDAGARMVYSSKDGTEWE